MTLANDQILFATAGYDHTIRFWKPHTGACYRILQHNESQVNCMAFHPEKAVLAAGGYQHVSIYDTGSNTANNNQAPLFNLEGTAKNTVAIGFQDRGAWMYTAGEDKTIRLWDMRSQRTLSCIRAINHSQPIQCVALHPNQVDLYFGDEIGSITKLDIRNNLKENITFPEPKSNTAIRSISINLDGTSMAAVNNEGSCWIWTLGGGFGDTETRILPRSQVYQPHQRYALKCLFSPDSTLLATSSADKTAKVWRTIDFGLNVECKHSNQKWVWDLAFTNDSQYLFTVSSDQTARLWSVQTGEIKTEYIGHQKPIVCLAFADSK